MQVDFKQILSGLRKRWWLALVVMLSAGGVAYLYSKAQTPIYQAQVTLAAKSVPPDNGTIEAIKKTLVTYAQDLHNKAFWADVIDGKYAGDPIQDVDLDALSGQIKVQPRPDDNSILMTVDNTDPYQAAVLADRISRAFVEKQAAENQDVNPGGQRIVWTIPQEAEQPTQPYQPRPLLNAGAAALFGLILGLLLAIGLELLDTTLKTPAEIQQYAGLNTLGVIPKT